jgi:hypothetical protein
MTSNASETKLQAAPAEPAAKTPAKAVKPATKPAAKKPAAKKPAAGKSSAGKPAARKPAAKKLTKPTKAKPAKSAAPKAKPADGGIDQKVIRDGFTMPRADYDKIKSLKAACLKSGVEVKKSEILRAGLHALEALPLQEMLLRIRGLMPIKAGRKKKKD